MYFLILIHQEINFLIKQFDKYKTTQRGLQFVGDPADKAGPTKSKSFKKFYSF